MKLIGSTTSAFVRKVRVVLAEKRLDYQFVEENPWSSDRVPGAGNPLGKVPRLVMDGNDAMFDSRVIVEYLDTLSPVGKLIPGTGRERAEIKTWEALADVAVGCALGWLDLRFPEINWRAEHPNLASLQAKLSERPSFVATRPPQA